MVTEGKDTAGAVTRLRELYDPDYNQYGPPSQRTATGKPVPAVKTKPEGGRDMENKKEPQGIRRDFRNYYKR